MDNNMTRDVKINRLIF